MTERLPAHLAILLGVSAATYATALAVVTTLQSDADRAAVVERRPVREAIDVVADARARSETVLDEATIRYLEVALRYDSLAPAVGDLEAALDVLTLQADAITDSASSLPDRVRLPSIPDPPPAPRSRPTTDGTTGASG